MTQSGLSDFLNVSDTTQAEFAKIPSGDSFNSKEFSVKMFSTRYSLHEGNTDTNPFPRIFVRH